MACNSCLRRVDGAPVGGAAAAAEWSRVYEVDWRDAFTDLGAVDLNAPGNTLTYEGVTWATPSIANTGVDQVAASTSWGLTANGLEIVGVNGGVLLASGPSFPHIFCNLADLAANTDTPFDGDPTRGYLIQAYVSAGNANANGEQSGVGLYKIEGIPFAGFSTTFVSFGQEVAVADIPIMTAGNTGAPGTFTRSDLTVTPFEVPTIHYASTGKTIDGFAGEFGADWPDNEDLRFIASYAENLEIDNDTPGDPFVGFRFVLGHFAGAASGYNAVIQRFRVCQF